ncbi:calpain-3-like isoform X2 [Cimex lectularius]|uniref:Calpain catalytic domain-containing protein n=1 Tax=Cimex lectularius TaxID=79782 RepID=A0A8I6TF94_CIMLE|nr:calpain-3-like isoform X2 [Cimex lectularius]
MSDGYHSHSATSERESPEKKAVFVDKFDFDLHAITLTSDEVLEVSWKRPTCFSVHPVFVPANFTPSNITSGKLGNKWVIAAIYNLQFNKKLFPFVVQVGQDFDANYYGVFHFRFWKFGKWYEIIVDDLLPFEAASDVPLFSRDNHQDSFWCPLLEKAFAKFHGSYNNLKNLTVPEIFTNFTGGLCEEVYTIKTNSGGFLQLQHRMKKRPFVCAHSKSDGRSKGKNFIPNHAYVVTSVEVVEASKLKSHLVQLRDPGGNIPKWKGKWSNSSIYWVTLSKKFRDEYLLNKDEALIWLAYDDFIRYFDYMLICNCQITNIWPREPDVKDEQFWDVTMFEGRWIKNKTAGGLPISQIGYKNPKYKFEILQNDKKSISPTTTLIALSQKPTTISLRQNDILETNSVVLGFYIYKVGDDKHYVYWKKSLDNMKLYSKSNFKKGQVSQKLFLNPGTYLIVPCTEKEGDEGDFLLRIFTEYPHQIPIAHQEHKVAGDFDTHVSLVAPNEIDLGQSIKISLLANNKGSNELVAMATLGIYSKSFRAYKPIKSQLEHIILSKKGAVEIPLCISYEEYGTKIDDHSLLCAIFEISGVESKYFDCGVKVISLRKPKIEFDADNICVTPSGLNMHAVFRNPLPVSLYPGYVSVEGNGISYQKKTFAEIPPDGIFNILFDCVPDTDYGDITATVTMEAIPLGVLKTSVRLSRSVLQKDETKVISCYNSPRRHKTMSFPSAQERKRR